MLRRKTSRPKYASVKDAHTWCPASREKVMPCANLISSGNYYWLIRYNLILYACRTDDLHWEFIDNANWLHATTETQMWCINFRQIFWPPFWLSGYSIFFTEKHGVRILGRADYISLRTIYKGHDDLWLPSVYTTSGGQNYPVFRQHASRIVQSHGIELHYLFDVK